MGNPYAPGAGTTPPVLVGREVQLRLIEDAAELVEEGRRPAHIVLTGLRGVGKTVLLRESLRQLRGRGWLCGYYEIRRDADVGVALGTILAEGGALLPARSKLGRMLRALRAGLASVELSGDPSGRLSVRVERSDHLPIQDPYLEAVRLLRELGDAARSDGVGVALCLDELQDFRRRDATTLLQALEAGADDDSRVLLLGAGLPGTPTELAKARTYAERLRYEPLDDLTDAEACRAVAEPAAALGVTWQDPALAEVVERAAHYPYFLQLHAREAWDAAAGAAEITRDHVLAALPRVRRQLEAGLYAARYERASPREKEYLQAMASLAVGGRARTGQIAAALGRGLAELSPIRDRLIRKGVVWASAPGELAFSVPGFSEYVTSRR